MASTGNHITFPKLFSWKLHGGENNKRKTVSVYLNESSDDDIDEDEDVNNEQGVVEDNVDFDDNDDAVDKDDEDGDAVGLVSECKVHTPDTNECALVLWSECTVDTPAKRECAPAKLVQRRTCLICIYILAVSLALFLYTPGFPNTVNTNNIGETTDGRCNLPLKQNKNNNDNNDVKVALDSTVTINPPQGTPNMILLFRMRIVFEYDLTIPDANSVFLLLTICQSNGGSHFVLISVCNFQISCC